jgi:hypothetical protein
MSSPPAPPRSPRSSPTLARAESGVPKRRPYTRRVQKDDEVPFELRVQRELVYDHDSRQFDRIAFAMRALERLAPRRLTVAVYPSSLSLNVQRGRDLRREGAEWAIVGIPPHASRAYIAYALAELAGVESLPYALQLMLADDRNAYR